MFSVSISLKIRALVVLAVLCLTAVVGLGQAEPSPSGQASPLSPPTGMVNDFAGVIDEATKRQLETKLREFKSKTNPPIELAVAIVRTTGEQDIFDYSLAVGRAWGIGSKEDDNPSALLFIAVDDRKYFTQVSRDLEDELPDGLVGSLQRQYLVPEFRRGNYAKGVTDTIDAYIRTIEARSSGGVAVPEANANSQRRERGVGASQGLYSAFCCLAVILVIGLIIWSNRGGKSKGDRDRWGGGGGFGGGGGALPWIIGSMIANAASSSSSSSSDWGGGSSDWGGGGGGSDWGGFGGGGDFGGGGAGGDW